MNRISIVLTCVLVMAIVGGIEAGCGTKFATGWCTDCGKTDERLDRGWVTWGECDVEGCDCMADLAKQRGAPFGQRLHLKIRCSRCNTNYKQRYNNFQRAEEPYNYKLD